MKRFLGIATLVVAVAGIAGGCGSDEKGDSHVEIDAGPDASAGGSGGTTGGSGGAPGGSGGVGGGGGAPPVGGSGGGIPDARSPEQTGQSCEVAADCFPDVDHSLLSGPVECLDRVEDGYCTHQCDTDEDCCAAEGECDTDLKQVCAPFESTGLRLCFLSCEGEDLRPGVDAGTLADGAPLEVDANEFCQREAHPAFVCRSTGGGQANRKVCVPGGDGGLPPPDDGGQTPDDGGQPPPQDASLVDSGDSATPEAGDATADATMDAMDATID
jgi:hypothetical protein